MSYNTTCLIIGGSTLACGFSLSIIYRYACVKEAILGVVSGYGAGLTLPKMTKKRTKVDLCFRWLVLVVAATVLIVLMGGHFYSYFKDDMGGYFKLNNSGSTASLAAGGHHHFSHPAKRDDLWVDVNPNENTLVRVEPGSFDSAQF